MPDARPDIFVARAAAAAEGRLWLAGYTQPRPMESAALSSLLLELAQSLIVEIAPADLAATGIILGTALGCLQADWEFDRSRRTDNARYASPAAFARTLPSTAAAELSVKLHLRGPLLTLVGGNASTALAVRRAVSWMHHMNLSYCLAGGFDSAPEFEERPGAALVLLSHTGAARDRLALKEPVAIDLESACDESLQRLQSWIMSGAFSYGCESCDLFGTPLNSTRAGQ